VLSERGPSTSAARLVAIALTVDMDAKTLETFAGVELLAKRTALAERTTRTALHVLKAEGWITERTKGRGRDYALRIRRATFPPGLPAMVAATQAAEVAAIAAGTQGNQVAATVAGTDARVAANGASSTGKKPHGVPAMVATYPVPEILNKNPGAASPSPADADSAAQEQIRARVWTLLRDGKADGEIVSELSGQVSVEQVEAWRRLRESMPMLRSPGGGSA
jgi:hypothetical protein